MKATISVHAQAFGALLLGAGMKTDIRPRLIACLLALLAAAPAARAQYTFTNIADSTSPTFSVLSGGRPSINAAGTVAFHGRW